MPLSLTLVVFGLLLGMRHALDPDHVVAVTTIVSRERTVSHAALIGALWGVGHTATIFLVGSAIILLKLHISPIVGISLELSVGVMLVLLGVLNLTGLLHRAMEWFSVRGYGSSAHVHVMFGRLIVHTHGAYEKFMSRQQYKAKNQQTWWMRVGLFQIVRPLAIGIVHGLAGSAAVALLVLATIKQPVWAVAYLLVFGLGTILGMVLVTAAIALPFAYTLRHFVGLNQGLAIASGVISLSFGLFLCYQIGISEGLLAGHPKWKPN